MSHAGRKQTSVNQFVGKGGIDSASVKLSTELVGGLHSKQAKENSNILT